MLREGAEGYSILKNYRKDGSSFWNFIQFAPMKDVNGQITLIVALQCEVSSPYLEDQDRDQVNEYEQQPNYNEFTASSTDNEQQRQEELRYQHNSRPPRYNSLTESKSLHSSTSCHPIIDSYTGVNSDDGGSSGGGYHNSSAPSSHTGSSSSGGHTSHDEQGSSSDNNSGSGNGSDSQSGSRNGSQQGDGPQDQCDRDSDEGGSNNGGGTHTFLWSHHHPPSDCTTSNKCDNDDISSNQQPNMWDTSSPSSSTKDNDSM